MLSIMVRKESSDSKGYTSRSARAAVTFSVNRISILLNGGGYAKGINETAPVFLAAVLEYLTIEVLELTHALAFESKTKIITPDILQSVIRSDTELRDIFKGITIVEEGALPSIDEALLFVKMKAVNLS